MYCRPIRNVSSRSASAEDLPVNSRLERQQYLADSTGRMLQLDGLLRDNATKVFRGPIRNFVGEAYHEE